MRIYESFDFNERFINPVLTIGNYDGLHTGHRRIIEGVKERARSLSGTSMLMTFDPHPLVLLKPERGTYCITPKNLKERLIEETGIDVLFMIPFTEQFRSIEPESFVKDILVDTLDIKVLVVGYDFRFGMGGRGNADMLRELSGVYGFEFEMVDAITLGGERIGSNRIRKLILQGNIEKANRFLGRPYMIEGTVVRGENRGTGIGYPTINLETDSGLIPEKGVYITETEPEEGLALRSVTNIGYNPTFGGTKRTIETFILEFSRELYGKKVKLYFHGRLRDEIQFKSVDALKDQISNDVKAAIDYFREPASE